MNNISNNQVISKCEAFDYMDDGRDVGAVVGDDVGLIEIPTTPEVKLGRYAF